MHSTESPKLGPSEVEYYMFLIEIGSRAKAGLINSVELSELAIQSATEAHRRLLAYFDEKYGRLHDVK